MYPFPECTSIAVSGAICSGKSTAVFRLLRHKEDMFLNPPDKVLYYYGLRQPLFKQLERKLPFIEFQHGIPNNKRIKVGDLVRVSFLRRPFQREYYKRRSRALFLIKEGL